MAEKDKEQRDIELLVTRLDERLGSLSRSVEKLVFIVEGQSQRFVTQKEFEPIRSLVYGLVGLILVSFLSSLAVFVFKH
jgi:hypothetical protein